MLFVERGVGGALGGGHPLLQAGDVCLQAGDVCLAVGHGFLQLLALLLLLLLLLVAQAGGGLVVGGGGRRGGRRGGVLGGGGAEDGVQAGGVGLGVLGAEEVVDAPDVFAHAAAAELVDLGDQAVQEVAVVAYDDDGAFERGYGLLQHVLGAHVQMIGGLVQDEEVDRLQQEFNHGQAGAFAAAQHADLLLRGFAAEHEGPEDVAYLQTDVAGGHAVDGVEHSQVFVQQLRLILGEVANLDVVAQGQASRVVGHFTQDALHQRRFALAVPAYEGHLLAAADGHVHVAEHRVRAVCLAHILADDGEVART